MAEDETVRRMTMLYLAWSSSGTRTLEQHSDEPVNLLVAYPALKAFERVRDRFNIDQWCLDSGAFSVLNSGKTIDLDEYTATCKDVDAVEVFGLDVIGDSEATRKNVESMWEAGVEAIPTFHYGQPWAALEWCASFAPKIALGGVARLGRKRYPWIGQCFARVWPKRVHGFGLASHEALNAVPFHSVDATSWIYAPAAMGMWAGYTGHQISLKARKVCDYWVEVEEHQRREKWAKWRWRKQLAKLEGAP